MNVERRSSEGSTARSVLIDAVTQIGRPGARRRFCHSSIGMAEPRTPPRCGLPRLPLLELESECVLCGALAAPPSPTEASLASFNPEGH